MTSLHVPTVVASHLTSEPSALVGFLFLGVVVSFLFLLVSSVEERRALWMVGAGWVAGIAGVLML